MVLANSVDPDEMPHNAVFHLGLYCLLYKVPILGSPVYKEGLIIQESHIGIQWPIHTV